MKKKIYLTFLVGLFGFVGINDVNAVTYKKYEDGTAVYYNPVTGTKCTDYIESNSTTGKKTGCMKFYTFNDSENSTTVNMILDHNTTGVVAWNSSGNYNSGMREVKTALESDTASWKETARLITANEVAKITGADDALEWSSSKPVSDESDTGDPTTEVSWFYLDGIGSTYSNANGWHKQVATTQGASKYAWLYDYTNGCTSRGCNVEDSDTRGYWTSSVVYDSIAAWIVSYCGELAFKLVDDRNSFGVRPVIRISKSLLDANNSNTNTSPGNNENNSNSNTSTDNNENNSNTNTSPGNNENNSNSNTSTDNNENNSNTNISTGNNENNSNTNTSTDNNENNSNTNASIDNNENNSNLDATTEKNPQTGIEKIGISVILIGLISFLVYMIVRNKKVFTK